MEAKYIPESGSSTKNSAVSVTTAGNSPFEFGGKLRSYLEEHLEENDITFYVGPYKKKIQALKIALKASSPVMDKIVREQWETTTKNENDESLINDKDGGGGGGGVNLPHFDPGAFEIFLKLLYADSLSVKEVEQMNLPSDTLFNLIIISKQFNLQDFEAIFEKAVTGFFDEFPKLIKNSKFLDFSRDVLELILASDLISISEMDIFSFACKWAETQCLKLEKDLTGPNLREVLGNIVLQIRFPLMSNSQFVDIVCPTNILTGSEELQILKYISKNNHNRSHKQSVGVGGLAFSTRKRNGRILNNTLTVSFFKNLKIVDDPPFVCDGTRTRLCLKVSDRILLESVGFLGPIISDCWYDVKVKVIRVRENEDTTVGKTTARLKVDRRQVFLAHFDKPIVLDATLARPGISSSSTDVGHYCIYFYLKGLDTESAVIPADPIGCHELRTEEDGVRFFCQWSGGQLAGLRFKRV